MRPKEEPADAKVQSTTFILSEKIDDPKSRKNEKEMKKELKRQEKEKLEREKKEKKAREKEKEKEKQGKKGNALNHSSHRRSLNRRTIHTYSVNIESPRTNILSSVSRSAFHFSPDVQCRLVAGQTYDDEVTVISARRDCTRRPRRRLPNATSDTRNKIGFFLRTNRRNWNSLIDFADVVSVGRVASAARSKYIYLPARYRISAG